MKTLMAAMLLMIVGFSSCTKEAPAIANAVRNKVIVVTGTFVDEKQAFFAQMTKGNDTRSGEWQTNLDSFRSPNPVVLDVLFTDGREDDGTVTGNLTIDAHLAGATKTDLGQGNYQYNGTGDWHVTKSTGTLIDFLHAGAGSFTYSVIDYAPADGQDFEPSAYRMELQGFTPR